MPTFHFSTALPRPDLCRCATDGFYRDLTTRDTRVAFDEAVIPDNPAMTLSDYFDIESGAVSGMAKRLLGVVGIQRAHFQCFTYRHARSATNRVRVLMRY